MFKKILLGITLTACAASTTQAQNQDYKNALGAKFLMHDYTLLDNGGFSPGFGGELSYHRYLNSSFNLATPVRLGTLRMMTDSTTTSSQFFAGLDITGLYKFNNGYILTEDAKAAPYLILGVGAKYLMSDSELDVQLPVGLGVNVSLNDRLNLQIQAEYRQSFLIQKSNLALTAGVTYALGKEKEEVPPPPKDTDGDGIVDTDDDCPTVAGLAQFNGCPDTDGDGIPDKEDDCPNEAGIKELNGCPDVDTDGDGLVDRKDKCPDEAGPIENEGCPYEEIEEKDEDFLTKAMDNVEFETGKAVLLQASEATLDGIADIMKKYPDYNLKIQGHTDNVGGDSDNLVLSRDRAQTCKDYLVGKGIDANRMETKGFGETKPLTANDTIEGQAKNRRVEFILYKP